MKDYLISEIKKIAILHMKGVDKEDVIKMMDMPAYRINNIYNKYISNNYYKELLEGELPEDF